MEKYKIEVVLESMSPKEWLSYKKFVAMTYSEIADAYEILTYLIDQKINNIENDLKSSIENAFPHLKSKVILNHLSSLYKIWEDWAIYQYIQENEKENKVLLIKALQKRGLYKLSNSIEKQTQKEIGQEKKWNVAHHKILYEIRLEQYYSYNPIKYNEDRDLLKEMAEAFLVHTNELIHIFIPELLNWGRIRKTDYSKTIQSMEAISTHLPSTEITQLMQTCKSMLLFQKENDFYTIYQALITEKLKEKSDLQLIVLMYCINTGLKLSSGKPEMIEALRSLYDYGMKHNVFAEHGKLTSLAFLNIIASLSGLQPYDKVNIFIDQWIKKVAVSYPLVTSNLAKAVNCLYHERYIEMHVFLINHEFNDFSEKSLQQRLYCMYTFVLRIQNYPHFIYTLNNFRQFIKRNKQRYSIKEYKALSNLAAFMAEADKAERSGKTIDLTKYEFLSHRFWCSKYSKRLSSGS